MREDISIKFEFGREFNYAGLSGNENKPEYARIAIDYGKLLIFLEQEGVHEYNYEDFRSNTWGESLPFKNFPSKKIPIPIIPSVIINGKSTRLSITANLNIKEGEINLGSSYKFQLKINPKHREEKYTIKIPFQNAQEDNDDDIAIVLHTDDFDHCLYLILKMHHNFDAALEQWVFDQFERAFDSYRDPDLLDFLYEQAPVWVIAKRDNTKVFNDLKLLLKGNVNEWGTNEELAVLKIIKSFATFPYYNDDAGNEDFNFKLNIDFLLKNSISEKIDGVSVFQTLYEKMNDYGGADNFSAFIQLYYLFWAESKYALEDNIAGSSDGHQIILDYTSNKILGYYHDGYGFAFQGDHIQISEESFSAFNPFVTYNTNIERPHIYQAINIPVIGQEGELKLLDNVVPAFYLKAFDDKNAWSDLENATWLVIDIITTFTGVGNLLKLRHLKKVVDAYKYIKIAVAGIEIASGVLGIMLNFIDQCDDPNEDSFCNKLRTFLIYVDLATLGVDALASKFIKKAAQDALNSMPNALRKKHPEIFLELQNAARKGQLSEKLKDSIRALLKKKGFIPKFNDVNIDLFDTSGKFIFRLGKDELELYFTLIELQKYKLKKLIKEGTKEILTDPIKKRSIFKADSKIAKQYKLKESNNKLCMDFDKTTKYLHKPQASFKIRLTGSREKDFEECVRIYNEKTGIPIDEIEALRSDGLFVWHHLDDLDENLECTMQFAQVGPHSAKHTGSVKQFEEISGIKYKT